MQFFQCVMESHEVRLGLHYSEDEILFAPAEEQSWAEAFHLEGGVKFLTVLPSVLFSFTLY